MCKKTQLNIIVLKIVIKKRVYKKWRFLVCFVFGDGFATRPRLTSNSPVSAFQLLGLKRVATTPGKRCLKRRQKPSGEVRDRQPPDWDQKKAENTGVYGPCY